jgi:polar amino acid transport system substrate-binding protein
MKWFWLACLIVGGVQANEPIALNFCYEDKPLPPYFLGSGVAVPNVMPGATIEMLQSLDKQYAAVKWVFHREPWKRCLEGIKKGRFDAIVASFTKARAGFSKYPENNGKLDTSKSIGYHASCLISRIDTHVEWKDGKLENAQDLTISIPRSYSVSEIVNSWQVKVHVSDSAYQSRHLLTEQRVDLSLTICGLIDNEAEFYKKRGLKLLFPPVQTKYGFLVFSESFYNRHTEHAEHLWEKLKKIDHSAYYKSYIDSF